MATPGCGPPADRTARCAASSTASPNATRTVRDYRSVLGNHVSRRRAGIGRVPVYELTTGRGVTVNIDKGASLPERLDALWEAWSRAFPDVVPRLGSEWGNVTELDSHRRMS